MPVAGVMIVANRGGEWVRELMKEWRRSGGDSTRVSSAEKISAIAKRIAHQEIHCLLVKFGER